MLFAVEGLEVVGQRLALVSGCCAMVVGAVIVGFCRECTRESTKEQLGIQKKIQSQNCEHSGSRVL